MWKLRRQILSLYHQHPNHRRPPLHHPMTTATTTTTTPEETPSLYSFLQPSLFSLKPSLTPPKTPTKTPTPNIPLTSSQKTHLENTLHTSLTTTTAAATATTATTAAAIDEAWKSFKTLTNSSLLPSKYLTNLMITHLLLHPNMLNLKRVFVTLVYLIEKTPSFLDFDTLNKVFVVMCDVNFVTPVFALVKCLFRNRVFVPWGVWGNVVGDMCRRNGCFDSYLGVFYECCRVGVDEKVEGVVPDLIGCNVALEGCCFGLESVGEAERVVELMTVLGVKPDVTSFGLLGYLYALKGLDEKIVELEDLMAGFGFRDKVPFMSNVIRGYVRAGTLGSVCKTMLQSLKEGSEENSHFSEETYCEVVNGFLKNGNVKDLASLIVEAQLCESESVIAERSTGFGIVNACVNLGLLDKAHNILDEMKARGASIGLGVYLSILRAYCKEQRTAEAAHLVTEISSSGLQLDAGSYDALIEVSMMSQDFQSAFSLYRDMRDARIPDLKGSYLTIMTGLTENNRPELMAAFLDEVVEDPRIDVGTHDWNSIIHAFCKAGRLEDASRTFRRMVFLHFEPNEQTYLSLINGYVSAEKYFSVLMLWNEVKKRVSADNSKAFKLDQSLIDAFLYALVKGGFFDTVMQVVDKSRELKIFVDKWRYKQAFMESHKKLKVSKLRRRNFRKMEALIAFKNWAGLNA